MQNGRGVLLAFGLLGSNPTTEDTLRIFPESSMWRKIPTVHATEINDIPYATLKE